jgi:acyl dehydratase
MALDPHKLLSAPPIRSRYVFDERDTMLYALGVGAHELKFVYEERLEALPTMAVVMGHPGFIWRDPLYGVDWKRIVHGETTLQIHRPLPTAGSLTGVTTLGPLFDKGRDKGAVCYQTRHVYDDTDTLLATIGAAIFMRGDGGFGGTCEGQPKPHALPQRQPDLAEILPTLENQGLIYRLSGDRNPLHVDPAVAAAAGFPRPILHGLCTYGVAGRAILSLLCENESARLKRLDVRFSSPVYPGETIRIDVWRESEGRAFFRAIAVERDLVVLNNGFAEYV